MPCPILGVESSDDCQHENVTPEVCDQTLGVLCLDCNTILAVCWMDEHIPESLWNRACENDKEANTCEQNRDDYCSLCGEYMDTK